MKGCWCRTTTTTTPPVLTPSPIPPRCSPPQSTWQIAPSTRTWKDGTTSHVTGYSYDTQGRLEKLRYPSGLVVGYGYDDHDRVDTIGIEGGAQILTHTGYTTDGSLEELTYPKVSETICTRRLRRHHRGHRPNRHQHPVVVRLHPRQRRTTPTDPRDQRGHPPRSR